jgi:hypothetical protein
MIQGGEFRPFVTRLFFVYEVPAAILLITTFVRFGAERLFFTVADGFDAIARHSRLNQRILHRVRAIRAKRQVIFGRTAFVAMSFDRDARRVLLRWHSKSQGAEPAAH